jgi:hypothetical protein
VQFPLRTDGQKSGLDTGLFLEVTGDHTCSRGCPTPACRGFPRAFSHIPFPVSEGLLATAEVLLLKFSNAETNRFLAHLVS